MPWQLDDNSRGAFHYLILGGLVVAALALANVALDSFHAPLGPNGVFGHGYLIEDDGEAMIVANTTRGERFGTGVALAFIAAAFIALLVTLITRMVRVAGYKWALIAGRTTFLFSTVYFMYAALFLPPREFIGIRDGAFIVWDRDVLMNDLPWPGEKRISLIGFGHVEEVRTSSHGTRRGLLVHEVIIHRASDPITVGSSADVATADSAAALFARGRVQHLRQMMIRP